MNVQAFLEVLPLAGEGMLGVFATIIVLIAGVALLNRFGKKKDSENKGISVRWPKSFAYLQGMC